MKEWPYLKFSLVPEAPGVGVLEIHRPEALNALNAEVISSLEDFFKEPPHGVRSLILTGSGEKAFVAGADIKEMEKFSRAEALAMAERGQALFQTIEDSTMVTIAAINGFALGGGLELAMACDVMVASDKARFGLPEVSLGLIPGYGGTQRLTRYIGKSLTRRVVFSGEIFSAQMGYDWGLFAEVVPAAELMARVQKMALVFASRSPSAIRMAKKAINQGYDFSQSQGLKLEAELFAQTFTTEDHVEGIRAFIEKRNPDFKGK